MGGGAPAWQAAELAARTSYGRLVARLTARHRDLAAAEDALSEAFAAALQRWPVDGVPDHPDAWLLTVARRKLLDGYRHAAVRERTRPDVEAWMTPDTTPTRDERLGLMLMCAHPGVPAAARSPLILQAVLGLDARTIAQAFLVSPSSMAQRLVRAKRRIRDAGVPFTTDAAEHLALDEQGPARIGAVLDAVYAAYGKGWDDRDGQERGPGGLAREALQLSAIVHEALPDDPEAMGLRALLLHCEARRDARRVDGAVVALDQQDPARWDGALQQEAESLLERAVIFRRFGRYQLEAAIQSAHMARLRGRARWSDIVRLYDALLGVAPSVGNRVGRAAAVGEASGPLAGLSALDAIDPVPAAYQPYWAVRAHLLRGVGRPEQAHAAYTRAIGLSEDPAVRAWLADRRDA